MLKIKSDCTTPKSYCTYSVFSSNLLHPRHGHTAHLQDQGRVPRPHHELLQRRPQPKGLLPALGWSSCLIPSFRCLTLSWNLTTPPCLFTSLSRTLTRYWSCSIALLLEDRNTYALFVDLLHWQRGPLRHLLQVARPFGTYCPHVASEKYEWWVFIPLLFVQDP